MNGKTIKAVALFLVLAMAIPFFSPVAALAETVAEQAEVGDTPASDMPAEAEMESTASAEEVLSDGADASLLKIKFKWAGESTTNSDNDDVCYYTDAYFTHSSTEYDASLCTASMCLAMASFGSNAAGNNLKIRSKNGLSFLRAAGFTNVTDNEDYRKETEPDTIGLVIGSKLIDDGFGNTVPLLAIGVRGSNYGAEWGGNFTLGAGETGTEDHAGFELAASKAVAFAEEYVLAHPDVFAGCDSMKLWIAGFSRAAATSNLTAAKLVRSGNVAGIPIAGEDIYAYTFETPSGGIEYNRVNGDYSNIFNIINPHDLVPMVAPSSFGFSQYGVNMLLPIKETDVNYSTKVAAMLKRLPKNAKYALDEFVPYKLKWVFGKLPYWYEENKSGVYSQSLFYESFVNNLANKVIGSRATYKADFEDGLRGIMRVIMAKCSAWQAVKFVAETAYRLFTTHIAEFFVAVFTGGVRDVANVIAKAMHTAAKHQGISIEGKDLTNAVIQIVPFLIKLIKSDPDMIACFGLDMYFRKGVLEGHSVSTIKAWLETMDKNYVGAEAADPDDVFIAGEYRMVRVTGDVSVEVVTGAGETTAFIDEDGTPIDETLTSGVNTKKEKYVYLPTNGDYTVKISAKAGAKFNYSVSEYSPAVATTGAKSNAKRMCYYSNVTAAAKETFVGMIPTYTESETRNGILLGSDYDYSLVNGSGASVTPTGNIKLREMNANYHTVSTIDDGGEFGVSYGGGVYLNGTNACLYARPFDGGKFLGWVDKTSGLLLSTEPEFDFAMNGSQPAAIEIIAKFGYNVIPSGVAAKNSATRANSAPQITVSWDKLPAVVSNLGIAPSEYIIYRSIGGGEPVRIGTTGGKQYSYLDASDSIVIGTEYTYYVTAVIEAGDETERSVAATVTAGKYWSFTNSVGSVSGYSSGAAPTGVKIERLARDDERNRHFVVEDEKRYAGSFDVTLIPEGSEIVSGSKFTVNFNIEGSSGASQMIVLHDRDVNGDGDVETLEGVANEGVLSVETASLSPFLAVSDAKVPGGEPENDDDDSEEVFDEPAGGDGVPSAIERTYYFASNGADGEMQPDGALRFVLAATLDDVRAVLVDDVALSAGEYVINAASQTIDLAAGFLAKLAAGEHTLTVKFGNGKAVTRFTTTSLLAATATELPPQTGDASVMIGFVMIALAAAGAICGAAVYRRKRG